MKQLRKKLKSKKLKPLLLESVLQQINKPAKLSKRDGKPNKRKRNLSRKKRQPVRNKKGLKNNLLRMLLTKLKRRVLMLKRLS